MAAVNRIKDTCNVQVLCRVPLGPKVSVCFCPLHLLLRQREAGKLTGRSCGPRCMVWWVVGVGQGRNTPPKEAHFSLSAWRVSGRVPNAPLFMHSTVVVGCAHSRPSQSVSLFDLQDHCNSQCPVWVCGPLTSHFNPLLF